MECNFTDSYLAKPALHLIQDLRKKCYCLPLLILSLNGYPTDKARNFYDSLLAKATIDAGVAAATVASDSPISGGWDQNSIEVRGICTKRRQKHVVQYYLHRH